MSGLSDRAAEHLRTLVEFPEVPGGRYQVLELVGRGGMGAVYRAHDLQLQRDVALKALAVTSDSEHFSLRLQREAQVLARLEHPGIVPVYDTGTLADGRVFYVMRFVQGLRLDQYARQGHGLGELLRVFLRICEPVAFAHTRGVIHRDLKPGNVMIGPFGEVLVLDWGVAKVLAEPGGQEPAAIAPSVADRPPAQSGLVTEAGTAIGTPGFMAPEQAAGNPDVDARADVFGLGVLLRELLTAAGGRVAPPLAAITARATAAAPGERYQTAAELAADVSRWLDGQPVNAYREGVLERAGRIYRRYETPILLLAAYAVVRVIILLWRGI